MYTHVLGFFILLGAVTPKSSLAYQDRRARQNDGIIFADNSSPSGRPVGTCKRFFHADHYGGEICGKDGETYPNAMYLHCLNRHRTKDEKIFIAHGGSCKNESEQLVECEKNMLYQPVCGSDNQTYANVEALRCKNAMVPEHNAKVVRSGECGHLSCPCHGDHTKVCASNGITYKSLGEVRCLKRHNPDLKVIHSGGCTVREVRRSLGRRMSCHMAKNRYEWNPVCGQNNLTYANPYLYICHHPQTEPKCAAKPGECGTLRQLACYRADLINQQKLESSSLVCGSNGVTYRSYEHLHCATVYDRHLEAVRTGRCNKGYDPCALNSKPLIGNGHPVCGSDNLSYVSIQALWCVKHIGKKDLQFKHDGACI